MRSVEREKTSDASGATTANTGTLKNSLTMTLVGQLVPFKRNGRTHSKKQIRQIADSIERFGFTNPVLVDDQNVILAGHGRVAAAKLLGLDFVPTVRLSAMSEVEKRTYVLADNKLAENAGWDLEILAGELEFLVSDPSLIDIGLTGFSISEIDTIFDGGETSNPTYDEKEEFVPAVRQDETIRLGDVWQLGDHRLVCGDARGETAYFRLMTNARGTAETAEMVFTDPPYNVRIRGNVSGSGRHGEFVMASGEMSSEAFVSFLASSTRLATEWSRDGSIHFICMDWRHASEMHAAGSQVYSEHKNLIVWVKDQAGMGSFYRSQHELIFVYKNGTGPHINSFELGQNGRSRTNVWRYRGATTPTKEARESLALHPTVKPVAMVVDAMKDCSQRGGIILDPFCGSGTIFIAAQKCGRRARAIELDPLYCDVTVRRWQAFANDDAILVDTGETFSEVEKRLSRERVTSQAEGSISK